MDTAVKEKWVAALRSGEYRQGYEALRSKTAHVGGTDEYCCLGVLCEIAAREGVIPPPQQEGQCYNYADQLAYLPDSVVEWAGLENRDPYVRHVGVEGHPDAEGLLGTHSLASLNDNNTPFTTIADLIEEQL